MISCESQPFAEGRFRYAYRGQYEYPPEKAGRKCVVKRKKSGCTYDPNGWDMCVKIQEEAQSFAQGYVRYCQTVVQRVQQLGPSLASQPLQLGPPGVPFGVGLPFVAQQIPPTHAYQITFTKIDTAEVSHGPGQMPEYVIVEDFLEGQYNKWVSNYGGISPESKVLPAFCHWSWVHTKGEKMIADLQGVRRDDIDTYILTDPAILTASGGGQMGGADTGIVGMSMFFMKHECNQWCRDLPRPTWERVVRSIPALQLQISPLQLLVAQLTNRNTVFFQELQSVAALSPVVRAALIRLFKQIAQGN